MKHNDAKTREEIRQAMQTALQQDDKAGFAAAMNDMMACIGEDIKQDYEDKIEQLRQQGADLPWRASADLCRKAVLPEAGRGNACRRPQAGIGKSGCCDA